MNKKIFIFTVSLFMLAAITGCGNEENSSVKQNSAAETMVTEVTEEVSEETTEPEKATDASTTQVTEPETDTDVDCSSIAGDWYFDGDPDAAHISISSKGTFTAYYASGNIENTGYIKYETAEGEETETNWYVLYTDDDEYFISFEDDGSYQKLDLYARGNGSPHYVLINGAGGLADDGRGEEEPAENYLGTWGCGRATLNISDNGDGTYQGKITWADSAFAYVEWVYILAFDADSQCMVCNKNAVKTYYEYKNENSEPEATVMYTGGSGSFYLENGVITWYDAEEDRGEDMGFVK